ncbi:MAG: ABC transporter ATP-binding protein [Ignavibacteriales bacterium]|nr:ABC transporter ATP-binding protein [Ignavibacteriales bacterium]
MMNTILFQTENIAKTFNNRKIFSEISFSLKERDSIAITGRNGSGKSTLLKILAGVLTPTRGTTDLKINNTTIKPEDYYNQLGLVSPYLQLYDEFTGWENLDFFRRVRNINVEDKYLDELLYKYNIWERRNDYVRTYSSGMKQRLKYAFAMIHKPPILLLDEPTSNLDAEGIATVYNTMEEQKKVGILIVATNDAEDIKHCGQVIDLNQQAGRRK